MPMLLDLYASQPFWLWFGVAVVLLGLAASLSIEWLLWPAAIAVVIALFGVVGFRPGFIVEAGLFGVLTFVATLLSERLIKKVNPADAPDINDVDLRLVGQRARVVEVFVDGRGRVFVSGSEWPAEITGEAPPVGESVVVEDAIGPLLKVRAV